MKPIAELSTRRPLVSLKDDGCSIRVTACSIRVTALLEYLDLAFLHVRSCQFWIGFFYTTRVRLFWVIQPGTNSQIGHLNGFCATGAGNLFLLDHVINNAELVAVAIFMVFTSLAWPDPFCAAAYRLEIISAALQGSGIVHESKKICIP